MMINRIVPFEDLTGSQKEEAAIILMEALAHAPSAWHDRSSAIAVVEQCVGNTERFGLGLLEDRELAGWIGAIRHSDFQWELHPLVIAPRHQRRGFGTTLVKALERKASEAGVCSIWLGTDDEFGGTNLHGVDLYPDVLENLRRLAPAKGHPYTFYQSVGFSVVGVLPDADGYGSHDILMAKQVT